MKQKKKYCPYCGTELETKIVEGRRRGYCPKEKRVIYDNPIPAVTAIITNTSDEILLVYRNIMPGKYRWALPGGFIELGESPMEAARRELKEETGLLALDPIIVEALYQESTFYHTSILIIGYYFRKYTGKPVAGDDAKEIGFFHIDNLPDMAFESHRELIRIFKHMKEEGKI